MFFESLEDKALNEIVAVLGFFFFEYFKDKTLVEIVAGFRQREGFLLFKSCEVGFEEIMEELLRVGLSGDFTSFEDEALGEGASGFGR